MCLCLHTTLDSQLSVIQRNKSTNYSRYGIKRSREEPFQVTREEPKLSQSDKVLYELCTRVRSEGNP
jgi:hypothetical protein